MQPGVSNISPLKLLSGSMLRQTSLERASLQLAWQGMYYPTSRCLRGMGRAPVAEGMVPHSQAGAVRGPGEAGRILCGHREAERALPVRC